jgi:asparagine synthase (glutamine-hydrolysing)
MCGIAGLWDIRSQVDVQERAAAIRHMARTLTHRGPDDEGYFQDESAGLALGHRRLSILDLSPLGRQPMVSASGRYVIAFNGEVYNFTALGRELELDGTAFRGRSDTEVMLAAIDEWGLMPAVTRFIGMFCFALWDRQNRTLFLVRDRLGIKPLYYGWAGGTFTFGSELKALRACPGFDNPVNRDALTLLLRHNYIPAPYSIHDNIHKLMPGTILAVTSRLAAAPQNLQTIAAHEDTYWSAREVTECGVAERFGGSREEAAQQLDRLLREAVGQRMVADVPLGAFLSGGIDSSTVVALMQTQSERRVKTFSIGFHEGGYNEAQHAKAVARHLGTDHTELYVTPEEAMAVIPNLPALYDEPFSDSSQIPTYLVSKLAREHVTVSLSGDGGDELFGGYNRYFWGRRLWAMLSRIPRPLRAVTGHALGAVRPALWGRVGALTAPLLPRHLRVSQSADKARLLAEILAVPSADALYRRLVSHWKYPEVLVSNTREPPTALTDPVRCAYLADYTERMMFADMVSYLPDDILAKVDRASMGVGLEARVPLLDHRVVEFAWRLPLDLKIREGQGKWLLRQVLYRYVPKELIERPKMGFGVPIEHWLRGPLRDWAEELLDERRLKQEGFFDPTPIRQKWAEHLSGQRAGHYCLWDVLMFQAWNEYSKRSTSYGGTNVEQAMTA